VRRGGRFPRRSGVSGTRALAQPRYLLVRRVDERRRSLPRTVRPQVSPNEPLLFAPIPDDAGLRPAEIRVAYATTPERDDSMKRTHLIARTCRRRISSAYSPMRMRLPKTLTVSQPTRRRIELTVGFEHRGPGHALPGTPPPRPTSHSAAKPTVRPSLAAAVRPATFDTLTQTLSGDDVSGVKGGSRTGTRRSRVQ